MNKLIIFLAMASLWSTVALAGDPEARAIMEKVDAVDDGDRRVSDMKMVLIDKRGKERVRSIRSFAMDQGQDSRSIIFFLDPADVRGTGFLTHDYADPDKDDDQWLYLPALKKSKRIAAGDKSGSFMGSDLNYSDMSSRDLDDFDYTMKGEKEVYGKKVWVIESMPKTPAIAEETGYSKSLLFIYQHNHMLVRAINWVEGKQELKYLDIKRMEKIDGIWTPLEMHVMTKQGKTVLHKTVLTFSNVRYNQDIDAGLFTLRGLEQGI